MPSHCSSRMEQSQLCPTKQTGNSSTSFFAVERWGLGYSSEQGRAMVWTSASHSSAKAHSRCLSADITCLRRGSLKYEFVQVLSLWLYPYATILFPKWCLQVLVGCIPSEGGFQDHKMSLSQFWLFFPLISILFFFFNCFSQIYMSPEVILCRGHTTKADIYSMGATIIHMQTGIPPWVNRYPRSAYPSYLYIVSVLSRASSVSVEAFPLSCWESSSRTKIIKIFVREMISSFLLQGREGRSGFWSFRGRQRLSWSCLCDFVSIYRPWVYWKDRVRSVWVLIETSPSVFYLSIFLRSCRYKLEPWQIWFSDSSSVVQKSGEFALHWNLGLLEVSLSFQIYYKIWFLKVRFYVVARFCELHVLFCLISPT